MRKIIFMAALCLVTINISAQNVYKEILRLSKVGAAFYSDWDINYILFLKPLFLE